VIPILFAIAYLPPLFEKIMQPYNELLQLNSQAQGAIQDVNLENLNLNKLFETYYK
jgi:hypothetical protein